MDKIRSRLNMSSFNSFRKAFLYFDVSSINYVERVQALVNNSIWAKQIDNDTTQTLFLFYVTVKKGMNVPINLASPKVPTHTPYINEINNMYTL